MTFTLEIDAEGRVKFPDEVRERLDRGEAVHVRKEMLHTASPRLRLSYEEDARLEMENGWPVIVGGESFDSEDTMEAIGRIRRERMAHVVGPGFTADDFE